MPSKSTSKPTSLAPSHSASPHPSSQPSSSQPPPPVEKKSRTESRKIIADERLKEILQDLHKAHITLERLLGAMCEYRKKHGKPWNGVKRFFFSNEFREAVFDEFNQREWEAFLKDTKVWPAIYQILRSELSRLATKQRAFSGFQVQRATNVKRLRLIVHERKLRSAAPRFLDLINFVAEPQRVRKYQNKKEEKDPSNSQSLEKELNAADVNHDASDDDIDDELDLSDEQSSDESESEPDSDDEGSPDEAQNSDKVQTLKERPEKGTIEYKRQRNLMKYAAAILSSFCYNSRKQRSNAFPLNLGIFLYQNGLTRQGLNTLATLGFTAGYKAVNTQLKKQIESNKIEVQLVGVCPNAIVAYDNLDFTDGVASPRQGDESKFRSVTTGEVHEGVFLTPTGERTEYPEGLKREWLDPGYHLRVSDLIPNNAEAFNKQEELRNSLFFYHVVTAIEDEFRGSTKAVFAGHRRPPPFSFPNIQRPKKPFTTTCLPLELMNFKESTNDGTKDIIEDIFNRQFKLVRNDKQWGDCFRIVFGDVLTTSRLQGHKAERSCETEDPYERLDWLLPVFGLWHLKYNYTQLLYEQHYRGPKGEHDSSTMFESNDNFYKNKSVDPKNYRRMEALIIHTWQANIIAVLSQIWADRHNGKLPGHQKDVRDWVAECTVDEFTSLIEEIMQRFSKDCNDVPDDRKDEEWCNHVNFVHNTLPFLNLRAAIKRADVGILRHAINDCCLIFVGTGKNGHYTRELLWYKFLTDSPASDEKLQLAVLYNSLVNPSGSKTGYYAEDESVEELNLTIKTMLWGKRTSSHETLAQLQRYCHNIKFFQRQRQAFAKVFHYGSAGYRPHKRGDSQIWLFARLMVQNGRTIPKPQPSIFVTRDLMNDAVGKLYDKIYIFNDFLLNVGLRGMLKPTDLKELEAFAHFWGYIEETLAAPEGVKTYRNFTDEMTLRLEPAETTTIDELNATAVEDIQRHGDHDDSNAVSFYSSETDRDILLGYGEDDT